MQDRGRSLTSPAVLSALVGAEHLMSRAGRAFWAVVLTFLFLPCDGLTQSRSVPWHSKRGANLVPDPSITTPSGWHLDEGDFCECSFDRSISRSRPGAVEVYLASCSQDASLVSSDSLLTDGSIRMKSYDHSCGRTGMVRSIRMPVEPGKTYTYSAYMRSGDWPSFIYMFVGMYDANDRFTFNRRGSRNGTTAPGEWQEVVIPFTATSYEAGVELYVRRSREEPQRGGCVWFDDPYLGEGVVFDNPPSAKRRFESDKLIIDSLGNFYLKEGQNIEPFFPIAIYGTSRRSDFEIYRAQGFNTVMRMDYPGGMQKAVDAGLYFVIDITGQILHARSRRDANAKADDLADLIRRMHAHVGPGGTRMRDHFLMYYCDNELLGQDWDVVQTVLQRVHSTEVEVSRRFGGSRNRQHPIYVLQGEYGVARSYDQLVDAAGVPLIDVVGTYVRDADEPQSPQKADALVVLDKMPGQTAPASFGQINDAGNASVTGKELRLRVYNILIAGGKAIGIFRDPYTAYDKGVGVEYSLWWKTLPQLVEEINELLPIIQQPHWTEWQVFADADNLGIGTRDYGGHGYILITNNNPFSVNTAFRIQGNVAASPPRYVMDYFRKSTVATISDSQFDILLLANATRVFKLVPTKEDLE